MLIVNPMLEGLTGPTKVKCQRHCRILKWNYEKLPRRYLVFCEESQKPAGGVEVVEFHDCYDTILLFCGFRYHCLFCNGNEINAFQLFIIFIYDISQD